MLSAGNEQIMLKNTFLSVESTARSKLCSEVTRRSKSADGLCCQSTITICEELEGFGSHAAEDQIHRLNRLCCLDRLDCLNRFNNDLSHGAALVKSSTTRCQMEHGQTWKPTYSRVTHLLHPICASQELHSTSSLVGFLELAGAPSCMHDKTPFSKEHEKDSKTSPCKQRAGTLCPDLSLPAMRQCEFTTAMIRNIPYHYTQDQFVGELSYLGFTSVCYDFLHLPSSKGKRSNVGYAFVNFKGAHVVQALKEALRKHRFNDLRGTCRKPPSLSAAACQGFMNNLVRFSQVSASNRTCGSPLIEVEGVGHRLLFEVM